MSPGMQPPRSRYKGVHRSPTQDPTRKPASKASPADSDPRPSAAERSRDSALSEARVRRDEVAHDNALAKAERLSAQARRSDRPALELESSARRVRDDLESVTEALGRGEKSALELARQDHARKVVAATRQLEESIGELRDAVAGAEQVEREAKRIPEVDTNSPEAPEFGFFVEEATLTVASAPHAEVRTSGLATLCRPDKVTVRDSKAVVAGSGCTLLSEAHYHVHKVRIELGPLLRLPPRASTALGKVVENPDDPHAVAEFQNAIADHKTSPPPRRQTQVSRPVSPGRR